MLFLGFDKPDGGSYPFDLSVLLDPSTELRDFGSTKSSYTHVRGSTDAKEPFPKKRKTSKHRPGAPPIETNMPNG